MSMGKKTVIEWTSPETQKKVHWEIELARERWTQKSLNEKKGNLEFEKDGL